MARIVKKRVEASLATGDKYAVPYWEADSGVEGPCLMVTAAQHGTELQGAEICRRLLPFLQEELSKGRCLLAPFANPEAVRRRQAHIDCEEDGKNQPNNVSGTWPGKADGSNAERLSYALAQTLVPQATHAIDIHCWQRGQGATALVQSGRQEANDLINVMGLPFARFKEWQPDVKERPVTPCLLRNYIHDTGRTAVTIEYSGQNGFWEDQIELGLRTMRNALRFLDMAPGEIEAPDRPTVWIGDCEETDVTAPATGVFAPAPLSLCDRIEKGASLGRIISTETLQVTDVTAPTDGIIYRIGAGDKKDVKRSSHPHMDEGTMLFTLLHPKGA